MESVAWVQGIAGDYRLHQAVVDGILRSDRRTYPESLIDDIIALPRGTKVLSADTFGRNAWMKAAKISVISPGGTPRRYSLKESCATGRAAQSATWGEFHSLETIKALVPDFCPQPVLKGEYDSTEGHVYFYLQEHHDVDFGFPPDPVEFVSLVAELHSKGTSPNGMFGYPVVTACGLIERTVTWERSWATSFSHQLKDVIRYDNEANCPWPAYDAACQQVIDHVIPRLLGVLQSDGREITPTLVHGNLWDGKVAYDMETDKLIIFEPGCTYAHNEIEFGTWRGTWTAILNSPIYMQLYQRTIPPSEPVEEWDDRNRLYAIRAFLNDSAGHPGSNSRRIAYNDMLYLCGKYAPLDTLEEYDPEIDPSVTGGGGP